MQSKEITSNQNPLVKKFVKLRTQRAFRHAEKEIILIGKKEVQEAKHLKVLLTGEPTDLAANETYLVTPEILKKVTGMTSPEPFAAIAAMPAMVNLENKQWILGLDGVSDPGNLGTLLRTALALGWEGVFLAPNCVDPFNEKALRAGRGAVLRLPLYMGTHDELIALGKNRPTWVADAMGKDLETVEKGAGLLILGGEANGPTSQIREGSEKIAIPIANMESLNVAVAGGILLYRLKT